MKITVKVRFNASKERCEKFGPNMYLVYLPFEQDSDTVNILAAVISRQLGVPPSKVEYAGQDHRKDWIFELV